MDQGSSKTIANGIIAAFVIMALAGTAGWLYLRSKGAFTKVASVDRTVIVLAATGEDGAQLAGIVAVATAGGSKVEMLDPLETVTITGTSYDKLRDAYPFGGAAAVATALGAKPGDGSGWVDVPEATWVAALEADSSTDASGVAGITVTLPKATDVFDGQRLASFREGANMVAAADVPLLLRGVAYLPESTRVAVAGEVGRAALRALAAKADPSSFTTDLTPEALTTLLAALRAP